MFLYSYHRAHNSLPLLPCSWLFRPIYIYKRTEYWIWDK